MLTSIARNLYSEKPDDLLYHYTGYQALLGISSSFELWATDIHYFNDSSELAYAVDIFCSVLASDEIRLVHQTELLQQLHQWLKQRLADGHMIFVVCFSEDGNLLSQWRSYTPHGNGISLGFDPEFLCACAGTQGFRLARCIYDKEQQRKVAMQAIDTILKVALAKGAAPVSVSPSHQSYFPSFYEQELDLLSIAALFKNPAFAAEREWRAVSPVLPNYVENPARYRAGRTTLIPYKPFLIRIDSESSIQVQRVYLGPTPVNNLAMNALSTFLSSNGMNPKDGLRTSCLPYRET